MGDDMKNTTLPPVANNKPDPGSSGFNELEKLLLLCIGVLLMLLIVQSICFIVYIIKPKRKIRENRKRSCIPYVREPLPNQENNSERYSVRPLKQVSDPEIYESLKDLLEEAPPLPPISTLPKRKPAEIKKTLDTPSGYDDEDKEVDTNISTRPRQPLPNEIEAARIMSKNNISATMPRMQFPKPVPTPVMSSTMARPTNRDNPLTNMKPKRPAKPEMLPPKPPSTLSLASNHMPTINQEFRLFTKPKSPIEVQNKYTLPPPEPNHEIPVENELMEKLKKRARLIPLSTEEIPVQQIPNNPTRVQPQQVKHEPYVQDELMQKLKKRAALIPDSINEKQMQPMNPARPVKIPKSKPLPPTPRRSDSEDTWVDYFDNREAAEQIHMYNI